MSEVRNTGPSSAEIEKKLNLSFGLFAMAFNIKFFQLSQRHPELTETEKIRQTHELFKNS